MNAKRGGNMILNGEKISTMIAARGLKKAAFAREIGIGNHTVLAASCGKEVGRKTAETIAAALGLELNDIVIDWSTVKKQRSEAKCDYDCFHCKYKDCVR